MAREVNVGLIGYGFMGKAHSNAYRQVARFFDLEAVPVMKVICGLYKEEAAAAADRFGWQESATDWRKVVARDDIKVIDVSTDNKTHAEIAIGAAEAGKHVICEKPLALTVAEARRMLRAVQKAKVKHMVCFNYRAVPAVALARQLIDEGRLGTLYHWRAVYLQDWIVDPNFPLVWRLRKSEAGSGAHGDLNSHLIDLSRFLVGEITEVVGDMKTFIPERPLLEATAGGLAAKGGRRKGKVTVDDATTFLARFANGAIGTFEASRFAPGRKNYNGFEINGAKGSLSFNFERMNELEFFDRTDPAPVQGWRTILATDGSHPYVGAWWPAGHLIGYEHTFTHLMYNFFRTFGRRANPKPDFADGLRCQMVLEAVEKSAQGRRWVTVPA